MKDNKPVIQFPHTVDQVLVVEQGGLHKRSLQIFGVKLMMSNSSCVRRTVCSQVEKGSIND
jgi:hypothetical protein